MIELIVIVVVLLVGGGWSVSMYNGIVTVRNNVENAWNNIDVVLQQRNEELPKLVDSCKAYMKHESSLLGRLVELRTGYATAKDLDQKVAAANEISGVLSELKMVWEQYPGLKAVQSFLQVQERVGAIESKIADHRETFNDAVNIYNIQIERLPDLLMARVTGAKRHTFLAVPEEKKGGPKLDFGA